MGGAAPGADAGAVGEALRRWLASRFTTDVELTEPAVSVSGGMDSWIHLVRFAGEGLPPEWRGALVARVLPSADRLEQAHREAFVQGWWASHGYVTPQVLAVLGPEETIGLPVQVMERVAGTTMLAAITARPWTAPALVDRLASLHADLHALDPAGMGGAGTGVSSLLDRRMSLARSVAGRGDQPALTAALARVERLVPSLEGAPPVVCHGDFHPLNVLVDGPRSSVIDWTDAGLGDRHGDVARTALLFRVAAIAAESRVERAGLRAIGPLLSRRYLRAYARRLPLDEARLRLWEPVHLLHGWAQTFALHTGTFEHITADDDRGGRVPATLTTWLQRRFERRMAELA